MILTFETEKLREQCNDRRRLVKAYGERRAKVLARRLDDLRAAVTLEDMRHVPGDCHEYRHRDDHTFTLDLDGGWRLFFRPGCEPPPLLPDGKSLDWPAVTAVMIIGVMDPHGKSKKRI